MSSSVEDQLETRHGYDTAINQIFDSALLLAPEQRRDYLASQNAQQFVGTLRFSALHMIAKREDVNSLIVPLLDLGADINAQDSSQRTPLMVAARNGRAEMTNILLSGKPKVNAVDWFGMTALHYAVQRSAMNNRAGLEYRLAQAIIHAGGDVNCLDNSMLTPLHHAVQNKNPEVARLLLENGGNINARSDEGSTPLHLCAKDKFIDATLLLLQANADVNAKDNRGLTAHDYAKNLSGKSLHWTACVDAWLASKVAKEAIYDLLGKVTTPCGAP